MAVIIKDCKTGLTQDYLKKILDYNSEDGIFTRKSTGKRIGVNRKTNHYVTILINGTMYHAHRLAWLWMTGEWPEECIDHINRIRWDNRWCNLRNTSMSDNGRNKPIISSNKTGFKGVHYSNRENCYIAQLHIGTYDNAEEAGEAWLRAAKLVFPDFY